MTKKFTKTYQVISLIVSRGMLVICLFQNIRTGANIAIDILNKKLTCDKEYIARFSRGINLIQYH